MPRPEQRSGAPWFAYFVDEGGVDWKRVGMWVIVALALLLILALFRSPPRVEILPLPEPLP